MAERKAAEDEFNPRHRIVGAVILVALAVIFLPMVLDDRPPEIATTPPTDVPAADAPTAGAAILDDPLTAAADRQPPPASTRPTRIVTVPVDPVPVAPRVERPVEPRPSLPAIVTPSARVEPPPVAPAATKPPVATRAATPVDGWTVQVGVFSQADNARRLQERLKAKGYDVILDPPSAPRGKTVRVEVGPYPDQGAARSAAARIERDFDIKGIVRSH